jgi:hypothetical protein
MLNPKALKAAVFTGWRDMDGYMRENKIDIVPPTMAPSQPAQDAHGEASAEKPAQAANAPPSAKPGETPPAADKGKPATPAKADKH